MSSFWSPPSTLQLLSTVLLLIILLLLTFANFLLPRLYRLLTRPPPSKASPATSPTKISGPTRKPCGHLLIMLGSGGHTAEMFSILRSLGSEYLDTRFSRRTWVVSSGDGFSVGRAVEFEAEMEDARKRQAGGSGSERRSQAGANSQQHDVTYTISTVRRARKVHQSLLTTPLSSLGCLWDCIRVLRGSRSPSMSTSDNNPRNAPEQEHNHTYPDLILTNGPGTGVIMVLASLILLLCGVGPASSSSSKPETGKSRKNDGDTKPGGAGSVAGAMRTIYIESWARVKSLSLSAKILRYMASRVLVQWREVGGGSADGGGVVDLTRVDGRMDGNGKRSNESDQGGSRRRQGQRQREHTRTEWPRKLEYVGAVVT